MKTNDLQRLQMEKGCSIKEARNHLINVEMKRQLDAAETYPQLLKLMRKILKHIIDRTFPPLK